VHRLFGRLWRYDDIDVFLTLYVMTMSLKVKRWATGSQCSDRSWGVECVSLGTCNTTRDKQFCILRRFAKFRLDVLYISELKYNNNNFRWDLSDQVQYKKLIGHGRNSSCNRLIEASCNNAAAVGANYHTCVSILRFARASSRYFSIRRRLRNSLTFTFTFSVRATSSGSDRRMWRIQRPYNLW